MKAHRRLIVGASMTIVLLVVAHLARSLLGATFDVHVSPGGGHVSFLLAVCDPGALKEAFTTLFEDDYGRALKGLFAVVMLLLQTLGLWCVALTTVAVLMRRRVATPVLLFPFLFTANYILMSLSLAGPTSLEFGHRPSVWAYFAVVVWTGGAAGSLAFGQRPPTSRARTCVLLIVLLSLPVPWLLSRNLQTVPSWAQFSSFEAFGAVPTCLVRASRYVRDNSTGVDVVQDSENDPRFIVAALTERPSFALDSMFRDSGHEGLRQRLDELTVFKAMTETAALEEFAVRHGISWYILRADSVVSWPPSFLDKAILECDGYRVFRFGPGRDGVDF